MAIWSPRLTDFASNAWRETRLSKDHEGEGEAERPQPA